MGSTEDLGDRLPSRIRMSVRRPGSFLAAGAYLGVIAIAGYATPTWIRGWSVVGLFITLHLLLGVASGRDITVLLPIVAFFVVLPRLPSDDGYFGLPSTMGIVWFVMFFPAPLLVVIGSGLRAFAKR